MSQIILPIAELKPALAGFGRVIAKRTTLPILGSLKIERTPDGWIAVSGTDLDHHATVRLEQPGPGEPAAMLIPYADLLKTCKACSNGEEIVVERNGENTAAIKYRIGEQFVETKVESLPIDEFPAIPEFKENPVPLPPTLRTAIHEAMQCASDDETRLILNGAYVDVSHPGGHYVVATDGRCLFSSNSFTLPLAKSLLIPSHRFLGWKEFSADGEWQLRIGESATNGDSPAFEISSRRWKFVSRQIEGQYPNWRQVVPNPSSYASTLEFESDVAGMVQTIQRMPCDDPVNCGIGLHWTNSKLALLARASGADDWTRVEVSGVKGEGKDVRIFLNRNFLIKALQFGLTKVELTDSRSPLCFSQGGRRMVVMPTRPSPVERAAGEPAAPSQTADPAPETQPKPTTPNPPAVPEQPERTPMPETTTSPSASTQPPLEKSALETALAQIDEVRGEFRNALGGLAKVFESLKQAQRESKASEKEISSVRQTLRSLQSVRL